jgi:hypothetical protein
MTWGTSSLRRGSANAIGILLHDIAVEEGNYVSTKHISGEKDEKQNVALVDDYCSICTSV